MPSCFSPPPPFSPPTIECDLIVYLFDIAD